MLIARLETDSKYYEISIVKDLLQDTVLVCYYGSKRTRFSRCKNIIQTTLRKINRITSIRDTKRRDHAIKLLEKKAFYKKPLKERASL